AVFLLHTLGLLLFRPLSPSALYTLSLHDALPISVAPPLQSVWFRTVDRVPDDPMLHQCLLAYASRHWWSIGSSGTRSTMRNQTRSEEHTSELQSLRHLVCRLLLEKKKKKTRREKN